MSPLLTSAPTGVMSLFWPFSNWPELLKTNSVDALLAVPCGVLLAEL
jgi:hypothetical protein